MTEPINELLAAHAHTVNNRAEIEASRLCGCYYCVQIFPPSEIVAWAGLELQDLADPDAIDGETALCPRCGTQSVLGDKSGCDLSLDFLGRMQTAWFKKTVVRKPGSNK